MPLHTNRPGSKNLVFVHPKNGKFEIDVNDEKQEYQSIEGSLELVRIEFDPGSPTNKIQPYDAFVMHIADAENTYRIKMNVERNFSFSVARVLGDIQKGDTIVATAKAGDDPTVTFCNIVKKDATGAWIRPVQKDLPADKAQRVDFLKKEVESHSAFSPKKEVTE